MSRVLSVVSVGLVLPFFFVTTHVLVVRILHVP